MIWNYQFTKGDCFGAITVDGKVCIGYTSLRKYTPKYIKQTSNRNNITCGWEKCISAMLLQSDLNKWSLLQLAKLDKLYINPALTILSQIFIINFIEYTKQIFSNISHIQLRSCNDASSYHFPSLNMGPKIPKWYCILNSFLIFQWWMLHI